MNKDYKVISFLCDTYTWLYSSQAHKLTIKIR